MTCHRMRPAMTDLFASFVIVHPFKSTLKCCVVSDLSEFFETSSFFRVLFWEQFGGQDSGGATL